MIVWLKIKIARLSSGARGIFLPFHPAASFLQTISSVRGNFPSFSLIYVCSVAMLRTTGFSFHHLDRRKILQINEQVYDWLNVIGRARNNQGLTRSHDNLFHSITRSPSEGSSSQWKDTRDKNREQSKLKRVWTMINDLKEKGNKSLFRGETWILIRSKVWACVVQ